VRGGHRREDAEEDRVKGGHSKTRKELEDSRGEGKN
jgi:hypothetical protein